MAAAEDTKKDADVKATKVRARRDRAATPAQPRPQPRPDGEILRAKHARDPRAEPKILRRPAPNRPAETRQSHRLPNFTPDGTGREGGPEG